MLRVSAVQPSPAVTILRLEGRLEQQVTGLLSDQVHAWLARAETVVLDLEGVVFIDAAGLALLEGWREAPVTCRGGSPFVRMLLRQGTVGGDDAPPVPPTERSGR